MIQKSSSAPMLLNATKTAELLGMSRRQFYRNKDTGLIPKPVYIGNSPRWRSDELNDWLVAGCPPAAKWRWIPSRKPSREHELTGRRFSETVK